VTAEPGQDGASGLKIQLGSITSRGIKETTSAPVTKDDIAIEQLPDIDDDAKASLRKLGVKSVKDLEAMEERNVDIEKATDSKLDYGSLANIINKARRRRMAPTVDKVGLAQGAEGPELRLRGDWLGIAKSLPATRGGRPATRRARRRTSAEMELRGRRQGRRGRLRRGPEVDPAGERRRRRKRAGDGRLHRARPGHRGAGAGRGRRRRRRRPA
jgi:hypothetical protein